MLTPTIKPAKSHYSESEAAVALGVSVDELRLLIRSHILKSDEDAPNPSSATFQPSDLLILRMMRSGLRAPEKPEPQTESVTLIA